MLKKFGLSIVLITAIFSFAEAQTKLVEKVTKKGDELVIPYEKFKLPNGLTLIIHEDHSDPVVHIDVTYHVGSAREEIGKSGFAHFFEHMMFQGSDNVADEEHFKIISEAGGTLNGTTNRDRTNYFETLPNNQLETGLWLEADRMGFLLDAVTQQKFEVQRETVKNERGQNYDNRPYGLAREMTAKNLYPYGHPYSWLTIGYLEDLDRVNVEDLKNFFLRWYGPNNAVLTVGGDVNPADVLRLTEKYFGAIPEGPAVENMQPILPIIEKDRYISYEDNVRNSLLNITFPVVESGHKDEHALNVLASVIGQGKNSILYKNFIKDQKALSAMAYNSGSELSGEFTISIMAYPNQGLNESEALVRQSLADFETRGVTDQDIIQYKATAESRVINRLASVSGKVSQLAYNQTFTGNPNNIQEELKRIQSVTKDDVLRVYNQYIKDKNSVILSVVPKGKPELVAKADNYTIDSEGYVAVADQYSGLSYNKAIDNFDRTQRPKPGTNPVVNVPDFWRNDYNNGLKVIGSESDEIPTVTFQLSMKGGHRLSMDNPEKAGISSLTAAMWNEDTENYSAEEFSNELELLGSSIRVSGGLDEIEIYVQTLKKNLDPTLELLEERMFRPLFNEDDFERLKKQQLEGIANSATQPTAIANQVYNKLLYGEGHFLSLPVSGTAETVASINLNDIKKFYKDSFSPSLAQLVIVGDIRKDDIKPKLTFLEKWQKKSITIADNAETPKIDKTRIYFVDKPDAAQSEIRIGYIAMPFDAFGDYYKSGLMNYTLGGAFNSRINLNLREDKGYTYGARSGYRGTRYGGTFTASAGVRADATAESITEFMNELTGYRDSGIREDEVSFMKSSIGQADARQYETPSQKAGFLGRLLEYDLNRDFVQKQTDILNNITKQELNSLARKNLPVENMHIVVVGDKKTVLPKLQHLDFEVVEVDINGDPIMADSAK